jgi:hypothetical protein
LKAVRRRGDATYNLQIPFHCHVALEQRGDAVVGLNFAADCRRLVIRRDHKAPEPLHLHVSRHVYKLERAGSTSGHGDIAIDGGHRCAAANGADAVDILGVRD